MSAIKVDDAHEGELGHMICMNEKGHYPKRLTHKVYVGDVAIGGDSPISVQSMLNAPADDARANLEQIAALEQAGCEIVRMAIPRAACLDAFEKVCSKSPLPVVADIHFDADIACEAARRGASKLRINPGNIGGLSKTDPVIEAAKEVKIPIRIGVNAGSLDKDIARDETLSLSQKLARSVTDYVSYFENERDFHDIVVSAKVNSVPSTIDTYRLLSKELPHIPLHIGVTEAGTTMQGLIKSASGLGILLDEGIGDTVRISLTDDPVVEVRAAWQLLSVLGIRLRGPEIISCPTCGRCEVDMIPIAKAIEAALSGIDKPMKVAVMGCVVNGPGEASDADVGVACGCGIGAIFANGKIKRKVSESEIIDALLEEIEQL